MQWGLSGALQAEEVDGAVTLGSLATKAPLHGEEGPCCQQGMLLLRDLWAWEESRQAVKGSEELASRKATHEVGLLLGCFLPSGGGGGGTGRYGGSLVDGWPGFLLLPCLLSCCPPHLSPFWPLPSDELEGECLAQLLRRFPSDFATSRNISLDAPLARHLHQCFYHLRLFRKWLVSGQGDLESLDGTARHGMTCL